MAEIYEQCALDVGDSASVEELVRCAMTLRRSLSITDGEDVYQYASTVLLVIAAALVIFMQTGFAMLCAGCVQRKNVQNTFLKNLLDSCGVALAYFSIGFAFSYGDMDDGVSTQKRFIGATKFFLQNEDNLGK
jgi:Amt family ammonium transporter